MPAPSVPAAPTAVITDTDGDADTVVVTWVAPAGTPTGYTVEHFVNTVLAAGDTQTVGAVLTATFTDVDAGSHTFEVSAVNGSGPSAYSAPSTAVVTTTPLLATPEAVTALTYNSGTKTLAWTDGDQGTSSISTHRLKHYLDGNLVANVLNTGLSKIYSDLAPGSHTFSVVATNASGDGLVEVVTSPYIVSAVPTPTAQAAAALSDGQATIPVAVAFDNVNGMVVPVAVRTLVLINNADAMDHVIKVSSDKDKYSGSSKFVTIPAGTEQMLMLVAHGKYAYLKETYLVAVDGDAYSSVNIQTIALL